MPRTIKTEAPTKIETAKNSISENVETSASKQENGNAEEWIRNIFKCEDGGFHCFYIDKEEQLCTHRFYQFLEDSNEIFGPGNYSDAELKILEKKYRKKWSGIYPLRSEELWLFGRGNDDDQNVKIKRLEKTGDLKYHLELVFGGGIETKNDIVLVPDGSSYKIDYCKTEFVEKEFSPTELEDLPHTVTFNFSGKNYTDHKITESQAKEMGLQRNTDFSKIPECGWEPEFLYGRKNHINIVFENSANKISGTLETLVFTNENYVVVDGFKINNATTETEFVKKLGNVSNYNAKNFPNEYRIPAGDAGYMKIIFKNKKAVMYRLVFYC